MSPAALLITQSHTRVTLRTLTAAAGGPSLGVLYHDLDNGLTDGRLSDCEIAGFDTGVQAGLTPAEHNASELLLSRVTIRRCRIGFHQVHDQGLNQKLTDCQFLDIADAAIWIERGGAVWIDGQQAGRIATLLRTGAGGPNTGTIHLSHFRLEEWTGTQPLFDIQFGWTQTEVSHFTLTSQIAPVAAPLIHVGANATLTLSHFRCDILNGKNATAVIEPAGRLIVADSSDWQFVTVINNGGYHEWRGPHQ